MEDLAVLLLVAAVTFLCHQAMDGFLHIDSREHAEVAHIVEQTTVGQDSLSIHETVYEAYQAALMKHDLALDILVAANQTNEKTLQNLKEACICEADSRSSGVPYKDYILAMAVHNLAKAAFEVASQVKHEATHDYERSANSV